MAHVADHYQALFIGAGAAGLATAIFAAQNNPDMSLAIVESAPRLGAKILVSGGGRCNVTHQAVGPNDYHGNRNIIRNILRGFGVEQTLAWFEQMGVTLKTEPTGKLFPITDDAATVRDALVNRCESLGVTILPNNRVGTIQANSGDGKGRFTVKTQRRTLATDALVLATGGKSLPKTGSDGHGWQLARDLGHSVTDTHAALVPLVLDDSFFHARLSGISHPVTITTRVEGKVADQRTGSMLWTHFGASGPVVMDASRCWTRADDSGRRVQMQIALLPDRTEPHVEQWLRPDADAAAAAQSVGARLSTELPGRVIKAVLDRLKIISTTPLNQMNKDDRRRLAQMLTAMDLPVVKHRGWNYAEVTAGGVPLNEIDFRTMQSRKTDGLYLVGEILDCDGRIGGFNFQWAWATGHLAGNALARRPIKIIQ